MNGRILASALVLIGSAIAIPHIHELPMDTDAEEMNRNLSAVDPMIAADPAALGADRTLEANG